MAARISFGRRLLLVLVPTKIQAFGCILIAMIIVVLAHASHLLENIGVTKQALQASSGQLHDHFSGVLTSSAASSLALVTFWATVGLVAYLVCWGVFNLLVEARNEITLGVSYTNRGHFKSPLEGLAVKATGGALLVGAISTLRPGIALWLSLSASAFSGFDVMSVATLIGALLGLAAQLYLLLACLIITITPWYREEAFTGTPT